MSVRTTFRSVSSKQYKDWVYRLSGLRVAGSPAAVPVNGVASSAVFTATPGPTRGTVAVLPTDFAQFNRDAALPVFAAHGGEIADLAFSPHSDYLLATVAKDDTVKAFALTTAADSGITGTLYASAGNLPGAQCLAWHPTVRGLLAVGFRDGIALVSLDTDAEGAFPLADGHAAKQAVEGRALFTFAAREVVTLSWSDDGALLAATAKDGAAYCFDPRATAPDALAPQDLGRIKTASCVVVTGSIAAKTAQLLVLGLGNARKPCYAFYAVSINPESGSYNVVSPTSSSAGDLPLSAGQLLAALDRDAALLYVTTRSSQTVTVVDVQAERSGPQSTLTQTFFPLQMPVTLASATKGFALLPKRLLAVADCEVARLASHSGESIELYAMSAVRKQRGWYPELFPDTPALAASNTLDDWAEGKDRAPAVMTLEPGAAAFAAQVAKFAAGATTGAVATGRVATAGASPSASGAAAGTMSSEAIAAAAAAAEAAAKAAAAAEAEAARHAALSFQSQARDAVTARLARSHLVHTSGNEGSTNKDHYTYQMKPVQQLPMGRTLAAGARFWALPLQVSGGAAVYVRPHTTVGRVPNDVTAVRSHQAALTALEFSPFDHQQLCTASEDGTVKVHQLPAVAAFDAASGELPSDIASAEWTFSANGSRVYWCKYHPYIPDVIFAFLFSPTAGDEVALYRVPKGTEGQSNDELATVYSGLTEQRVQDCDFSPDGATAALAARDNTVTFVSFPSGRVLGRYAPPQHTKELLVRFVDADHIVTVGFARGTERCASLINVTKALEGASDAVLATVPIPNVSTPVVHFDPATHLLIVGGVGSSTFTIVHVHRFQAPHLDVLSNFTSRADVVGSAALPKRDVDVREVEMLRTVKFNKNGEIHPISWRVPRKRKEFFQDDLYASGAPAESGLASLSDWISGAVEREVQVSGRAGQTKFAQSTVSLRPAGMPLLSEAPEEELSAGQKKYVAQQLLKKAEPAKGFLGHTSSEDAMQYFRDKAETGVVNSGRFSAKTVAHDDVADDEWD